MFRPRLRLISIAAFSLFVCSFVFWPASATDRRPFSSAEPRGETSFGKDSLAFAPPDPQTPYGGTAAAVPGVIQVENYDNGGEGIAYHDTTATNDGGYYRGDGVDICGCGSPYGLSVGWTSNGEWLEYTINVASSQTYRFDLLTATVIAGTTLHIEIDGSDVTGQMTMPNTGAWGSYATTSSPPVNVSAGQHILRLSIDAGGYLIDSISVVTLQTPYGGTAAAVPGVIQVENYDNGGEGIAYHDTTATNDGGYYRAEGVDICSCGSPYGLSVGWTGNGEWLKYTINVTASDDYRFDLLTTTIVSGTTAHLEIDGVDVTGQLALPNTGGWSSYATTSASNIHLTAGQHVLKLSIDAGGYLIDSITVTGLNLPAPPTRLLATPVSPSQINLSWSDNSSNEAGFKIERKTGVAGTYAQVATTAANATSYNNTGLSSSTQYFYRVRANNSAGDSGYSNETSASTQNNAPTVAITSPATNATFANDSTINIAADAADSDGTISKVEFFQGTTKLGEDTNGSDGYAFSWAHVFAGSYQLTAKATDNSGATVTSSIINVAVTLPIITISATDSAAAEAGSDTGTFTITRTGGTSAALGITFSVSGTASSGSDYSSLGSSTPIPTGAASATIMVTPVDDAAVEGTETVILTLASNSSHTLGNPAAATVNISDNDTYPPTVSLTAPSAGTVVTAPGNLTLTANASDSDGTITKVAFYQNDQLLGEDTTSPFSFAWSNVAAGSYKLKAVATDNANATGTSAVVSVVINAPPTVSITSPANNAAFTGSSITINASAGDSDGGVTKVEFFEGAAKLGEDTSSPYSLVWNNASEGNHTLTAVATDAYGAATTSGAVQIAFINFNQARLDPWNRVGGGDDPLSRNFNWNLPLVNLPGRAGLDLGLALSYNSLVWTKSGNYISFNDDRGIPAPGFRLGFPVIQPGFNSPTNQYSFIMLTPSGSRVELRQVGTGNLYQSTDSSYLLLDATTMTLKTSDGTQLSYSLQGSDYQCTQIKDRNGNFITINYDGSGRIDKVIDTLAREVKFNYIGSDLTSIAQTWTVNGQQQTYTWAMFTYTDQTVQTNFSGLTVVGLENGATIHALTKVTFPDGSHYDFDYTSWGQVWKIRSYGIADNLLNYRSYNLRGSPMEPTGTESDCPRFTERRDWAANSNGDTNGEPTGTEEVSTTFAVPADAAMPDGSYQTVTRTQVTLPDGTYQQMYFAGTIAGGAGSTPPWQRGLPLATATFGRSDPNSNIIEQRRSLTIWTQDNTNAAYQLNPRVTETHVYDFDANSQIQNHARTSMDYSAFTLSDGTTVSLPQNVYEYQANATAVLRRTHTTYKTDPNNSVLLDPTYANPNRHIIGLVNDKSLYEINPNTGAETVMSKVSYQYDETGSIQGADQPVKHDNANFSASFREGRANLSSVKRYDVTNTDFTTSSFQYNTAGAVVATHDPLNHGVTIGYADQFAVNGTTLDTVTTLSGATLAYPTTVTDADGYTSSTRYNYQFGAQTWKQTPRPNVATPAEGNQNGPQEKIAYDEFGRPEQITNLVNDAYTKFNYGPNYVEIWSTVNTLADEAHSLQVFDGYGRVIAKANNHPGSSGGFSGQLIIYDQMGRVVKQTNPTETSLETISLTVPLHPSSWSVAGDDYPGSGVAPALGYQPGWFVTTQTYDWKGRPLVTTNSDNTMRSATYTGCGCAGGEAVTLTDEVGRRQKVYSDVLGRQWKTEVLNWDGSVYATTAQTFNARDQVTLVRQYAGTDHSSTYQDTSSTFDGYGRLQSRHIPEQNQGTATLWSYNVDDSVNNVTDARGSSATYVYNNRGLVSQIIYTPSANVPDTPDVSFSYDAVGNRTSMNDGLGSATYNYNSLSRITSETRTLAGVGELTLSYDYNLAGQLKSVADPWNGHIAYSHDSSGRLAAVTGSGFADVTQYASGMQYRAWGNLKREIYGNSNYPQAISWGYNSRMLTSGVEIRYANTNALEQSESYAFMADGFVQSSHEATNPIQDRAYTYDQVGRLVAGLTGEEARGETVTDPTNILFKQQYGFDAFSNLTNRTGNYWGQSAQALTASYVNNRNTAWSYDAAGDLLQEGSRQYSYDAAGKNVSVTEPPRRANQLGLNESQLFDGDGHQIKQIINGVTTYYLRSSALGGAVVAELNAQGNKTLGYVYANGAVLAKQEQASNRVTWVQHSPGSTGEWVTYSDLIGTVRSVEVDPLMNDVGVENPSVTGGSAGGDGHSYPVYGDPAAPATCALNDDVLPCDYVMKVLHRDQFQMILATISARIGIPSRESRTEPSVAPGSILLGENEDFSVDPKTLQIVDSPSVTVAPNPEVLETIESTNVTTQWLDLQSSRSLYEIRLPQGLGIAKPLKDLEELKTLMQNRLDYDHCKDAVDELVAKLAENARNSSRPENQPIFGNVMDVFNKMNSEGGIRINVPRGEYPPGQRVQGGAGYSWREPVKASNQDVTWNYKTWIYLITVFKEEPRWAARTPYDYGITGIHEMLHQISRYTYNEDELNQAGRDLGGQDIDDYLKKHCVPADSR